MNIIVHQLQQILHAQEEVRFLNLYRGIPISYHGNVVEVGKQTVRFRVHPNQILCIKRDKYTLLESNLLPRVVKASLFSADMGAKRVLLGKFEYEGTTVGKRLHVRVEPRNPLQLTLTTSSEEIPADLVDISLRGLAVLIVPHLFNTRLSKSDKQVKAHLELPLHRQTAQISIEGIIRSISQETVEKTLKIGILTFPDSDAELLLSKYIARRQKEIIKELDKLTSQKLEAD
jgi:hypothetical protein